jgi:transcriptional regulator with XRE-family HTH domain
MRRLSAAARGPSPFPPLLVRFRTTAGLSQKDLGLAVGVSPSYITHLERGDRNPPSREIVGTIGKALALAPGDADRLMIAAGYAPEWLVQLAGVARVTPRELRDAG